MKIWLIKFGEETKDGYCMTEKRFGGETIFEVIEKAKQWLSESSLSSKQIKEGYIAFIKDCPETKITLKDYERSRIEDWSITSIILVDNLEDVD